MKTFFCSVPSDSPYETLALEEALLDTLSEDQMILLLYRHRACVILGRNQNAWAECRTDELQQCGAEVARRISGGGAVYHDPANLNYSFIMPRTRYDLHRQCSVLLDAVSAFGIDAAFSGRNDLVASGSKFSGNAFCFRGRNAFHHGTILINTDLAAMDRVLSASQAKFRAKGIRSVRARVVNLKELVPSLDARSMRAALVNSFAKTYGTPAPLEISAAVARRAAQLAERNRSWDWIYGRTPRFEMEFANRFPWGEVQILFQLQAGHIGEAAVYSDALHTDLIESLPTSLRGLRLDAEELCTKLVSLAAPEEQQMCDDLCRLLRTHIH